ncbi:YunG family protein [Bradyrhizobium hipponense]|uniref:YunG family protein n=1 Tax=Bradyrhizobium hipponense TaxID=2605638 RepID=UPI001F246B70|nr:hypothetical protein [Bradyrhizobium hipponense]
MSFDPDEVESALRKAWSLSTVRQLTANNPAAGQCNVTALLIHELFGGDLLKTPLPAGDHFYDRIGGRRYDLTASQFDQPIVYLDVPANRVDAELGATKDELAELRAAFQEHRDGAPNRSHGRSKSRATRSLRLRVREGRRGL